MATVDGMCLTLRMGDVTINWRASKDLLESLRIYWQGCLDEVCLADSDWRQESWAVAFRRATGIPEKSVVDTAARQIRHWHTGESEFLESQSLFRELITKIGLMTGIVWLHGCAFQMDQSTILVVGRKGAGKTTWLTTALAKCGGRFICNDQAGLEGNAGPPLIRRWRPDVKIAPATLELLGLAPAYRGRPERLLWMMTEGSAATMDVEGYSRRRHQEVALYEQPPPTPAPLGPHPLTAVVFLTDQSLGRIKHITPGAAADCWLQIERDPEVLLPSCLESWNETHSFWTKRVLGLQASGEACRQGMERVNRLFELVPAYRSTVRLHPDQICSFLEGISK